jgi:saccharopine dehydrogenase-like NADP-dependent oxidoreductase
MIDTTRKNLATAERAREGAETAPQLGIPQISFAPGVAAG